MTTEASKYPTSSHGYRFAQDFHDDDGRLIHAEWDGSLWTLKDADTGELVGVWDKAALPSKYDLTFPAPFVAFEDQTRRE